MWTTTVYGKPWYLLDGKYVSMEGVIQAQFEPNWITLTYVSGHTLVLNVPEQDRAQIKEYFRCLVNGENS